MLFRLLILVIYSKKKKKKKKNDYQTRIGEIGKKILDYEHAKYIAIREFNKLTANVSTARLAQSKLAPKDDIADLVKEILIII